MDFSGYDLILTPNHRLSVTLKINIPVYSLSQWVEKAYSEVPNPKTLLNSHQQRFLIQSLMAQHFPDYVGLAPLVQSAWRLCAHYQVDIQSSTFEKNDDTRLFQIIAKTIDKHYRKYNLTDLDQTLSQLALPQNTGLFGFQSLTPLEQQLLSSGVAIKSGRFAKKMTQSIFPDPDTEFKTMVLWASQQPQDKQIACIISDLESQRDKLEYLFDTVRDDPKSLTLSAVKKLSAYYFVQDTLALLNHEDKNLTQKPSEWAILFEQQLKTKGFPRKLPLNNEEFQLAEKFNDIISIYKTYDFVGNTLNFDHALAELHSLCDRIPFQVTASKTANIHVLSVLESQGLWFDHAWITGMDARHWPQHSRPNPFLPFPHTEKKQPEFNTIAEEIIYSYPLQNSDESIIPSEILKNIPVENINLKWPTPTVGRSLITNAIRDDNVPVELNQLKRHGSQIFKDHIACPFRAFAKHRLHAVKIEETQMGLNAIQKGNAVHEVLENVWKAIQSKQNLLTLDQNNLHKLIEAIIDNSLRKFKNIMQSVFIQAEKLRLEKLVLDWLELEKTRHDFTVIATEQILETQLGQLPLKLRIDRIDQIGPDKYLIIDYKTSQYDLRGDYLDEPQLPLYAIISAISVDKISYAYLRTGNSKLKEIPVGDLKHQWETELLKIAEDFLKGNTEVKPKYGEETCRLCELQSLCRVKSSPSALSL